MRDRHLSRDELIAWRDDGAGDRNRIITHLAACAPCREAAAEIERNRPADGANTRFDTVEFAARGYRAGTAAGVQRLAPRWTWAAAAAALIVIALIPAWLARVDDPATTLRGTATIVLVAPVDASISADALAFEWSGTSDADRVRLNVVDLDRPAEPIIEREVMGSRYTPTPEERQRFEPNHTYHWYVEGRGNGTATSPAASFTVR